MPDVYWQEGDSDRLKVALQGNDLCGPIPNEDDEEDIILSQSDYYPAPKERLTPYDIDMLTWRDFL